MSPVRVVIVDDHPVFRLGLSALLSSLPGIELAGAAVDAAEAVRTVVEQRPDVVLMDVQLPGGSGIAATRQIRRDCPASAVIMLTMHESSDAVLQSVRAGASGYLLKGADPDELERAIRTVAAGGTVFGAAAAERVRELLDPARDAGPEALPGLTARETQIVNLVAAGHGNHAVARALGLSSKTVANNLSAILVKLAVPDRAAVIALARRAGLGAERRAR
jgi:DNA-binding NarL/FixJ family response regulator